MYNIAQPLNIEKRINTALCDRLVPISSAVIYPEKSKIIGSWLETEEYHTNYYIIQEKIDHLTIHGRYILQIWSYSVLARVPDVNNKKCTSAQQS